MFISVVSGNKGMCFPKHQNNVVRAAAPSVVCVCCILLLKTLWKETHTSKAVDNVSIFLSQGKYNLKNTFIIRPCISALLKVHSRYFDSLSQNVN